MKDKMPHLSRDMDKPVNDKQIKNPPKPESVKYEGEGERAPSGKKYLGHGPE